MQQFGGAYGYGTCAGERGTPARQTRSEKMQPKKTNGPDSLWKHKAKVLATFLALCLVTAYSGIGFAA